MSGAGKAAAEEMAQKESGADTLLHVKKVSVRGGGFAKIAQ